MRDLSNLLWSDLTDDEERVAFLESGRAWETGIIAPVMVDEIINAFKCCMVMRREIEGLLEAGKSLYDECTDAMTQDQVDRIGRMCKKEIDLFYSPKCG